MHTHTHTHTHSVYIVSNWAHRQLRGLNSVISVSRKLLTSLFFGITFYQIMTNSSNVLLVMPHEMLTFPASCLAVTDIHTALFKINFLDKPLTTFRSISLEKEIATRSSTLAWKIPWMEEPGRLQSMGWLRVGHD